MCAMSACVDEKLRVHELSIAVPKPQDKLCPPLPREHVVQIVGDVYVRAVRKGRHAQRPKRNSHRRDVDSHELLRDVTIAV